MVPATFLWRERQNSALVTLYLKEANRHALTVALDCFPERTGQTSLIQHDLSCFWWEDHPFSRRLFLLCCCSLPCCYQLFLIGLVQLIYTEGYQIHFQPWRSDALQLHSDVISDIICNIYLMKCCNAFTWYNNLQYSLFYRFFYFWCINLCCTLLLIFYNHPNEFEF